MGNVPSGFLEIAPKDMAILTVMLYELEYEIAKSTSPRKRQAQLRELCSLVEKFRHSSPVYQQNTQRKNQ